MQEGPTGFVEDGNVGTAPEGETGGVLEAQGQLGRPAKTGRPRKVLAVIGCCVLAVAVAVGIWWTVAHGSVDPFAHEPGQMPDLSQALDRGVKDSGYIDDVAGLFPFNTDSTAAELDGEGLSVFMRNASGEPEWMLKGDKGDAASGTGYGASWMPMFFHGYGSPVSDAAGALPSSGLDLLAFTEYCPSSFDGIGSEQVASLLDASGFDGSSLSVGSEAYLMRPVGTAFDKVADVETGGEGSQTSADFGVRYVLAGTVNDRQGKAHGVSFVYDEGGTALWADVGGDAPQLQFVPMGQRVRLDVRRDGEAADDPMPADDQGWVAVEQGWRPGLPETTDGETPTDAEVADALKGIYDSLAVVNEETNMAEARFDHSYLTSTMGQRQVCAMDAQRLVEESAAVEMSADAFINYGSLPEGSACYDAGQSLLALSNDLYQRALRLMEAWDKDVSYEDPAAHREEILAVLDADDNDQGVNTYKAHFDENYPRWPESLPKQ